MCWSGMRDISTRRINKTTGRVRELAATELLGKRDANLEHIGPITVQSLFCSNTWPSTLDTRTSNTNPVGHRGCHRIFSNVCVSANLASSDSTASSLPTPVVATFRSICELRAIHNGDSAWDLERVVQGGEQARLSHQDPECELPSAILTGGPGRRAPEELETHKVVLVDDKEACVMFFGRGNVLVTTGKDTLTEKQVSLILSCFQDPRVTNWLCPMKERERVKALTFTAFFSEFRKFYLRTNWQLETRTQVMTACMKETDTFDIVAAKKALKGKAPARTTTLPIVIVMPHVNDNNDSSDSDSKDDRTQALVEKLALFLDIKVHPAPRTPKPQPTMKLKENLKKTDTDYKLMVKEHTAVCEWRRTYVEDNNLFEAVKPVDIVTAIHECHM
ncbi:hypothetical protein B0H19DRAFT_1064946 [Mycena capillaripes]|nr:hypothetical protein B0H19DRAFT_1064946 [Mycena capillaripes]